MNIFDYEKVSSFAIDYPEHQQIYIHDHQHREKIIKTLLEMGFDTCYDLMNLEYIHLPIIVNTKDKVFFTASSIAVMASVVQCGAKIISYNDMIELIVKNK